MYMLFHFFNLYLLPFIEYGIMILTDPSGSQTDMVMSILFGYIPMGCFAISVLYGVKKREGFILHSISASLLCVFSVFFPFITGKGVLERLSSMLIIGFSYFVISLMGGIVGIIGYNMFISIKKRLKSPK